MVDYEKIKVLRSIESQLNALRSRYNQTFANVSPFNPASRFVIQTHLPKMQQELREISRRVGLINPSTLGSQEVGVWYEINALLEELEEDLF